MFKINTYMVREKINCRTIKIESPADIFELVKDDMQKECVEIVKVIFLTTRNNVIGISEVSRGSIDTSILSPSQIFRAAILANAASIIIVHNHPSGDPEPSHEDVRITKKLIEAGILLTIPVLDHIVIGDTFKSIKEAL